MFRVSPRDAGAEKKKAVSHAFAAASASRLALSCARSRLPLRFGLAFAGVSAASTGGAGAAGAGRAAAGGGEKRAGAGGAIEPGAKGVSKRGCGSGTEDACAACCWNGWWGPKWGTVTWWNGGGC